MNSQVIGLIMLVLLMVAFIVISILNKKTPIPKSCEQAYHDAAESGCDSCAISGGCSIREALDIMKEVDLT
ncbi:MAG TPA: hypothetical protein VJY66_01860 [Acholeplasma sp.]|nr:hypothetical protein [Acholeplasma sp.]